MKSAITCTHTKYYYGDKFKEDEMGRARGTRGRDNKCLQNFYCKTQKGRDHSEHLGVGRGIILEWILGK
jgi:hypothetical protein